MTGAQRSTVAASSPGIGSRFTCMCPPPVNHRQQSAPLAAPMRRGLLQLCARYCSRRSAASRNLIRASIAFSLAMSIALEGTRVDASGVTKDPMAATTKGSGRPPLTPK